MPKRDDDLLYEVMALYPSGWKSQYLFDSWFQAIGYSAFLVMRKIDKPTLEYTTVRVEEIR